MSLDRVYVVIRDPSDGNYPTLASTCAGVFFDYNSAAKELLRQGYRHLASGVWMPYEQGSPEARREFDEFVSDASKYTEDARWDLWRRAPECAVHVFCLPVNTFVDQLAVEFIEKDHPDVLRDSD